MKGMEVIMLIATWFLYFFIFSVIGWCFEMLLQVLRIYRTSGKIINRGFLFGPYCPIYGVGGVLILAIFANLSWLNPALLFLLIAATCTALEYLISYLLEKQFHVRWWDYSKIYKFDLNGRVCLASFLAFGTLGIIMIYWWQPWLAGIIADIPEVWLLIISGILAFGMLIDLGLSVKILKSVKKKLKRKKRYDSTGDIRAETEKLLEKELNKIKKRKGR